MPTDVVHSLTAERNPLRRRRSAARRERSVISMTDIERMVNMAIEVSWPPIKGTRADKDAAVEPFGAVIAIRRAVVRRRLVVTVRANWRAPRYSHGDPRRPARGDEKRNSKCSHRYVCFACHTGAGAIRFPSFAERPRALPQGLPSSQSGAIERANCTDFSSTRDKLAASQS